MGFKENLRRILTEKKVTVKEIARKSGLSADEIYKWRTGLRHPRSPELHMLAMALETTMDALFEGEGK